MRGNLGHTSSPKQTRRSRGKTLPVVTPVIDSSQRRTPLKTYRIPKRPTPYQSEQQAPLQMSDIFREVRPCLLHYPVIKQITKTLGPYVVISVGYSRPILVHLDGATMVRSRNGRKMHKTRLGAMVLGYDDHVTRFFGAVVLRFSIVEPSKYRVSASKVKRGPLKCPRIF